MVQGINLISLVWTDGNACLPCDFRLYNKAQDGLDKNDHFQAMVRIAKERGFQPAIVAFDSWYSSLDNLKLLRELDWHWLTRLKSNRQVSLRVGHQQAVDRLDIPGLDLVVHLRGYGMVRVFRTVDPHGNAEYWATSRLDLTEVARKAYADRAWLIEGCHRSLKQFTGLKLVNFGSNVANATTLAWRYVLTSVLNVTAGGITWHFSMPSLTSFAKPYVSICFSLGSFYLQLRNV